MIRHHLSGQRELLLNDQDSMSSLRTMLETYICADWDKAARLAEELDDLFNCGHVADGAFEPHSR
jgi:hypothetical protein